MVFRLRENCNQGQWSEDEIHRVIGVLDVNAFEIRCTLNDSGFRGLYPIASLLSHSCIANTVMCHGKEVRKVSTLIHKADSKSRQVVITIFTHAVRPSVPTFNKSGKIKQNKVQMNSDRYWRECGSGRGDHLITCLVLPKFNFKCIII